MDAAIALGLVAGEETDFASVDGLIKYFREAWFDGPRMKANDFTDLSEYFVRGAVPVALALARDRDGNSPPEALDFLIEVLQNNNNGGNPYTDDNLVAGAIEALGFSKPGAEHVGQMVTIVGRYFDKDAARSSFQNVVSGACVRALAALASTCAGDPAAYRALGPAVARVLNARDHDRSYLGVRRAVMAGSMELSAGRGGYRPLLQSLVQFTRAGLPPKLACDLLDDARALAEILLARLGDAASCDPAHLAFLQQVAMDRAPEVGAGPRLQHKAFEMLQVLGGRPPTLYRATDRDAHALAFARAEEARGPSKVAAAPPPKRPRPKPKAPRPAAAGPKITIAAPAKAAGAPEGVAADALQKRAKPAAPIRRTTLPNGAVLEVDQEVEAKYLNQVSKPAAVGRRRGIGRAGDRGLTGRAPPPSSLPSPGVVPGEDLPHQPGGHVRHPVQRRGLRPAHPAEPDPAEGRVEHEDVAVQVGWRRGRRLPARRPCASPPPRPSGRLGRSGRPTTSWSPPSGRPRSGRPRRAVVRGGASRPVPADLPHPRCETLEGAQANGPARRAPRSRLT